MSDLSTAIETARGEIAHIARRIGELWEHLYASDGPIPEQARKEQRKRSESPALYNGDQQVKAAYNDVVDELARAHWQLGRHTNVPVHWTVLPTDEWVARQDDPLPTWRKPTVPHSEALAWTHVLAGMLAWLADADLTSAQQQAVVTACAHITSAQGRIEDLWPSEHTPLPDPPRVCLHCGVRDVEKERKWCSACRRAHQRDRGRCQVCGLSVAS